MTLSAESNLSLSLLKIASVRSRTTQLQKIAILVCVSYRGELAHRLLIRDF